MDVWPTTYTLKDVRDVARIIGKTKKREIDSYGKKETFSKVRKLSPTMQNATLRAMIILGLLCKEEKAVKGAVSVSIFRATPKLGKLCRTSVTTKIGEKLSEKEKEFFRKLLLKYTPTKRALFFFKREAGSKDFRKLARETFPECIGKYSMETLEERSKAIYYVLREVDLVDAQYRTTDLAQKLIFPLREVAKLLEKRFEELGYRIVMSPNQFRGISLNYLVAYGDPFMEDLPFLFVYVKKEAAVNAKVAEAIRMLEEDEKPIAIIAIAPGVKRSCIQTVQKDTSTIPLRVMDVSVLLGGVSVWLPELRKTIAETFKSGTGMLLEALLKTSPSKRLSLSDISVQMGVRKSSLKQPLQEMAEVGLIEWFADRVKNEDIFWITHSGKKAVKRLRDLYKSISKRPSEKGVNLR